MDADIKWLVGDMRLGATGFRNGQPFTIGITIGVLMDGSCQLQRIDRPLTPEGWKAIGRRLARAGFWVCEFERKREGQTQPEYHPIKLDRFHKELRNEALAKIRSSGLVPADFDRDRCPCCSRHLYVDCE